MKACPKCGSVSTTFMDRQGTCRNKPCGYTGPRTNFGAGPDNRWGQTRDTEYLLGSGTRKVTSYNEDK